MPRAIAGHRGPPHYDTNKPGVNATRRLFATPWHIIVFSHRTSHCIPSHRAVEASYISERCRAATPFHPDSQRRCCSAPNRVAPRRQTPLHMISLQHRIARSRAPRPFHSKLPSAVICTRDGNTTHHLIAMALPCLRSQKFSVISVLPSKNCLRAA